MHSYSTDVNRLSVLSRIAGLSFLTCLLLTGILNNIIQKVVAFIPYLEKAPSLPTLAIFGSIFALFYLTFDKVLWRFSVRGLDLSKTPDLRGDWEGYIVTDYDVGEKIDVKVKIKQTWTSIEIMLETKNSISRSHAASIVTSESRLLYYYLNEPNSNSIETMHLHYGVATLNILDSNKLEGQYFTGRDRKTCGDMYLQKCKL
jgi:hypothetical protein